MQLKVALSERDHLQGSTDATVTLVEYGDYQCPDCVRAHPIVKLLQKRFGDSLRFAFRNFPLAQIHPFAELAAEAAEFAGARGQFWEMHDGIFERHSPLSSELLFSLARSYGLDVSAMTEALDKQAFLERVKEDFMGGVRSGVNGTPTFFVNGKRHDHGTDFESLAEAINASRNQLDPRLLPALTV
jgi:protein-disulfide isomerase